MYFKLKKQDEVLSIYETSYNPESSVLKSKYDQQYFEINNQIASIVNGETQVNITEEEKQKYGITGDVSNQEQGIPDFWPIAIKNAKFFTVNEKDEKLLKHLKDVRMQPIGDNKIDFSVTFHFQGTEAFQPNVLRVEYHHDEKSEELVKVVGTEITWASSQDNPTIKIKTKKSKTSNLKF